MVAGARRPGQRQHPGQDHRLFLRGDGGAPWRRSGTADRHARPPLAGHRCATARARSARGRIPGALGRRADPDRRSAGPRPARRTPPAAFRCRAPRQPGSGERCVPAGPARIPCRPLSRRQLPAMAARAAGTGRAGEAGAACLRRPAGARARRESAAAAVAALRRRSAGAAPAGTAAAGAGLCPRRFAGGRRTDPAGVRRIARRSLAGRVAGGTRRTGPGRIGGAAGGSSGRAAGAPGVDLRTVRRQRGGGAGGGLFRLAGRPARRCRQLAGGAPAVAGGAHCAAGATTPARSRPAGGDSPGLPGRAASRPLPAAAPGQRTRRRRSALVGGLPPERGAGCRSAAADRAAACLALRTAVAAQCRRRGRAVPALALSRCARTVTLPGAAPGVASAVRPGTPGGGWRWAWRRSARTGR